MAKRKKPLPKIAERTVTDGYVYSCDKNGRPCLDVSQRERVVITNDLRTYSPDLCIGSLGWTKPKDSDGYKFTGVEFDNGVCLRLKKYTFEQIAPESAEKISAELIDMNRGTRFDQNSETAEVQRKRWIDDSYGKYISLMDTHLAGQGDQEVYGFTFPSLVELAQLKGQETYPVKIGHSENTFDGAVGRIRYQISESAAYPEKPLVLFILKTWASRKTEGVVHKWLRSNGRKITTSLGIEWFQTSKNELLSFLPSLPAPNFDSDRIICGAGETLDESIGALVEEGYAFEAGMVPESASVAFSIRPPDKAE